MRNLKHSKFKNTGVLFELLVRQVASDTLNNSDSKAIPLIKKYFARSTELAKELSLYQTLVKEKFSREDKANSLIEAVLAAKDNLNRSTLNRQKYNLIKEIKNNYVLEDFFKSKVNNYKTLAAIYKLFEYTVADNPVEIVNNKYTIVEHITRTESKKTSAVNEMADFIKQDKEVRLLSYKILVDKFNDKYKVLTTEQKSVLRNYINNIDNSDNLKRFILRETKKLKNEFSKIKVSDKVYSIKLKEVIGLIDNLSNSKIVSETQALGLLRYYQLLNELKGI